MGIPQRGQRRRGQKVKIDNIQVRVLGKAVARNWVSWSSIIPSNFVGGSHSRSHHLRGRLSLFNVINTSMNGQNSTPLLLILHAKGMCTMPLQWRRRRRRRDATRRAQISAAAAAAAATAASLSPHIRVCHFRRQEDVLNTCLGCFDSISVDE